MDLNAEFLAEVLNLQYCPHENTDSSVCTGICTNQEAIAKREEKIKKYTSLFVKEVV